MVRLLSLIFVSSQLVACSWVERQVTNVEQRLNQSNHCEQVSQREASDFSQTKRYRCVGGDCQSYGCRQ